MLIFNFVWQTKRSIGYVEVIIFLASFQENARIITVMTHASAIHNKSARSSKYRIRSRDYRNKLA
jgi:hypothetical protein